MQLERVPARQVSELVFVADSLGRQFCIKLGVSGPPVGKAVSDLDL